MLMTLELKDWMPSDCIGPPSGPNSISNAWKDIEKTANWTGGQAFKDSEEEVYQ